MKEEIHVSKDVDKAIIMSLKSQPDVKLSTVLITGYVRKYARTTPGAIYKKIERFRQKQYLLFEKDESKNYIHWLNPEIDFILDGPPLRTLVNSIEGVSSAQLEHSSVLKEAIKNWINNLTEPSPYLQVGASKIFDELSVARSCENHVLFHDLSNHLPKLGINIFELWYEYKLDLDNLPRLKIELLCQLMKEIIKCFEGLKFEYMHNGEESTSDDALWGLSIALHDILILSERGDKHISEELVKDTKDDTHISYDKDGKILYSSCGIMLRVDEKDKALLAESLTKYIVLVKSPPNPEFTQMAKNIISEVDKMKPKRENILRTLNGAMHYAYFPGRCEYLQPD
jgi:hypothetical protein